MKNFFQKLFKKQVVDKLDTEIVDNCPMCDVEDCQTFEDLNVIEQGMELRFFCHNCSRSFIVHYTLDNVEQEAI